MPRRPADPSAADATAVPPDFESSFARLEELVASMEGDELPLEELLTHHEEGRRLLRHCHQLLEAAEERLREVDLAAEDPAPSPSAAAAQPVDAGDRPSRDAPPSADSPSAPGSDPDDIRLF